MTRASSERVLAILDLFSEDRLEWSSQDMMDVLGYARPTLYRYLKVLKDTGFIAPMQGGGFGLGPRFVEMDFLARKSDPLVAHGQPHLEALAGQFPGTAFLVRWYGERILCVASVSRDARARTSYPRGRPMPLLNGAAAKAILAYLPRRRQRQLAEQAGDQSGTDLLDAFRTIRRDGLATAHGEVTTGIVGTAAPIFDSSANPIASLCVSMEEAAYQATDSTLLADAIRTATRVLSMDLAGPDPRKTYLISAGGAP